VAVVVPQAVVVGGQGLDGSQGQHMHVDVI
jgi:hypothetical protein